MNFYITSYDGVENAFIPKFRFREQADLWALLGKQSTWGRQDPQLLLNVGANTICKNKNLDYVLKYIKSEMVKK